MAEKKTKAQLAQELESLRQKIGKLEWAGPTYL